MGLRGVGRGWQLGEHSGCEGRREDSVLCQEDWVRAVSSLGNRQGGETEAEDHYQVLVECSVQAALQSLCLCTGKRSLQPEAP